MVTYIKEKELHKGIEKAMQALNHAQVVTGKNQDRTDSLKEIHLVMDIESVQNVRVTMAMPSDLYTLVDYVLEIVEGVKDFEKDMYDYTYHDLFSENLQFVIDKLKEDPDTRQATLHVSNQKAARLDHPPCLQLIHYTIKENKLNTDVVFRSNDGVKAVAMNTFAIIELSRMIAREVGVKELGSYTHHAISFHAYSKDWTELEGYCAMFEQRDCSMEYTDYLDVYEERAQEFRLLCKQLEKDFKKK